MYYLTSVFTYYKQSDNRLKSLAGFAGIDIDSEAFVNGMHLAHKPGMSLWSYRILQTISVFVLLAAEAVFLIVLVWLISGHGVIACGRGVFDDPNWAAFVVSIVGLPGAFMIGAGALFLWCANRADLTSQPVTD